MERVQFAVEANRIDRGCWGRCALSLVGPRAQRHRRDPAYRRRLSCGRHEERGRSRHLRGEGVTWNIATAPLRRIAKHARSGYSPTIPRSFGLTSTLSRLRYRLLPKKSAASKGEGRRLSGAQVMTSLFETTARPRPSFAELFTPKLMTVLREGYGPRQFHADAIAGLTVAIVAL